MKAKKPIKVKRGKLHKEMGIPAGKDLPDAKVDAELAKLKAKTKKTKAELTRQRQLQFAVNSRKWKKRT